MEESETPLEFQQGQPGNRLDKRFIAVLNGARKHPDAYPVDIQDKNIYDQQPFIHVMGDVSTTLEGLGISSVIEEGSVDTVVKRTVAELADTLSDRWDYFKKNQQKEHPQIDDWSLYSSDNWTKEMNAQLLYRFSMKSGAKALGLENTDRGKEVAKKIATTLAKNMRGYPYWMVYLHNNRDTRRLSTGEWKQQPHPSDAYWVWSIQKVLRDTGMKDIEMRAALEDDIPTLQSRPYSTEERQNKTAHYFQQLKSSGLLPD